MVLHCLYSVSHVFVMTYSEPGKYVGSCTLSETHYLFNTEI